MLFTLLISLASALVQNFGWESESDNGEQLAYPPTQFENIKLEVNNIYPFWFGASGTFAFQSFYTTSNLYMDVIIIDAFCTGDTFILYDNGQAVGTCSPPADDQCAAYTSDVNEAYSNSAYCNIFYYSQQYLFHNYTIQVVNSPYEYGQAFLWYVVD